MRIRSERKHSEKISYFDDVFFENADGSVISLSETISDPKSNFTETIIEVEIFERVLSIIFNVLNKKHRFVALSSFAGKKQIEIGSTMGLSQSYIARILEKAFSDIRKYMELSFKETISIEISNGFYYISFFNKDIPNFSQSYMNLLTKHHEIENINNFRVVIEKQRTKIYLPADVENFIYLAYLFQELDNFQSNFSGNKNSKNLLLQ